MNNIIDNRVYDVVEEFINDVWSIKNIGHTYISVTVRNKKTYPGGGFIMWGLISVGYFLTQLPLAYAVSAVITGFFIYQYYSIYARSRDGMIRFSLRGNTIICLGAHGVDKTRIKHICVNHGLQYSFEHSNARSIELWPRRYR